MIGDLITFVRTNVRLMSWSTLESVRSSVLRPSETRFANIHQSRVNLSHLTLDLARNTRYALNPILPPSLLSNETAPPRSASQPCSARGCQQLAPGLLCNLHGELFPPLATDCVLHSVMRMTSKTCHHPHYISYMIIIFNKRELQPLQLNSQLPQITIPTLHTQLTYNAPATLQHQ
jgi:hypothetical protein